MLRSGCSGASVLTQSGQRHRWFLSLPGSPHRLGLFAKLVKDSSGRSFVRGVNHFTEKEQYRFGDVSKAALGKIGSGVKKSGLKIGSGVRKGGLKIGSGVKKSGRKINSGVNHFTGKEQYHFGDVSKAALGKIGSGVKQKVSGITGRQTYRFGDLTRSAVRKLQPRRKKKTRRRGRPRRPPAEIAIQGPKDPQDAPADAGGRGDPKVTGARRHAQGPPASRSEGRPAGTSQSAPR